MLIAVTRRFCLQTSGDKDVQMGREIFEEHKMNNSEETIAVVLIILMAGVMLIIAVSCMLWSISLSDYVPPTPPACYMWKGW
jgi:hypothetical protein